MQYIEAASKGIEAAIEATKAHTMDALLLSEEKILTMTTVNHAITFMVALLRSTRRYTGLTKKLCHNGKYSRRVPFLK
jgi:hypothetical protein